MGYVIVYKRNKKRVRQKGQLTPYFQYPAQAFNYIKRYMGDSQYVDIFDTRNARK